jgi:hypothetical protein
VAGVRWLRDRFRPVATTDPAAVRPDQRPHLAAAMCARCARRWLAGKSIGDPWCAVRLRHAFDLYFERLRDI